MYAMETFLNSYIEVKKRKSCLNSVLSVLCARTYVPIGEGGDVREDQINDRKARYSDRASHHWIYRYAVRGNCLCVYVCVCVRVCMRLYMRVYV